MTSYPGAPPQALILQIRSGDLTAEVTRLRNAGLTFRNDIVVGPGGQQILLADPAGNVVELFQRAES